MADTFNWRDYLDVHPACAAFPELSLDELRALGIDIKTNGLRLPIVVYAEGDAFKLLDGRSRLDAMALAGIEFKIERAHCKQHGCRPRLILPDTVPESPQGNVQTAYGFNEDEIKALVLSLNAIRRHLNAKSKRAAIDVLLKLDPGKSDRQIAGQIGSSPTTVGKQRKKAEIAGAVSKMDTRTDTKGRKQPATKKATDHLDEHDPDAVADPEDVLENVLHDLGRATALAHAYKKVFKLSSFDPEAKIRIDEAITKLINKWRSVQTTLTRSEATEDEVQAGRGMDDAAASDNDLEIPGFLRRAAQ